MLQASGDNEFFQDNDVRINTNSINPRNFNTNSYNINSNMGYPVNNNNNNVPNNNANVNASTNSYNMPVINARNDYGTSPNMININGLYSGVGADSVGGFYSGGGGGGGAGTASHVETDNKSIVSTPSRISKFTYSGTFLTF